MARRAATWGWVLLLASGCARPLVRSPGSPAGAVRVHPPKAHLALSRLAAPGPDGATHETHLLLLPDLDRPRWISLRPGWGSVSVEADLEHGVLAAFAAATDGRGAEVGRALGDAAERVLGRARAAGVRTGPLAGEAPVEALYEIVARDDGGVDLVEVEGEEARRRLARVAALPSRERVRLPP